MKGRPARRDEVVLLNPDGSHLHAQIKSPENLFGFGTGFPFGSVSSRGRFTERACSGSLSGSGGLIGFLHGRDYTLLKPDRMNFTARHQATAGGIDDLYPLAWTWAFRLGLGIFGQVTGSLG